MENENNIVRSSSVYSHKVKAGRKRTYFFDVMRTKGNDFYLTLTESTRRSDGEGYTRHQIFLYKEDFNRFNEGLMDVINHVKNELLPDYDYDQFAHRESTSENQSDGQEDHNSPDPTIPNKEEEDMKW